MTALPFVREGRGSLILEVVLSPRSSKNKISGEYNGRLKISITAPPVDGKANEALCKYLAKLLKVPCGAVNVIKGQTSREKSVEITGISEKNLAEVLDLHSISN